MASRLSWVAGTAGSSSLQSMSQTSPNRCPTAPTFSRLWGWQTSDHRPCTSQYCVACLDMQPQLGYLDCHLLPPLASLRVQLESAIVITGLVLAIPVEAVLVESQLPPISMCFQTMSLLKADEWANHPPADDRRQTLFTTCRQRLKRKD